MQRLRMVRLTTAASAFEARVIAARLGADGVIWELRGNVDGPFAFGPVEVLVAEDELDLARKLLVEGEVESAFDDVAAEQVDSPVRFQDVLLGAALVALVVLFALSRILVHG
jgi:hypothetical protein